MTFLAVSMVALKSISVPLESESFKVIKLSTLVFVNAESSVFLIASLKAVSYTHLTLPTICSV